MDYIRYINSEAIRNNLYQIGYALSLEQKIFVVDNCLFISLDKKINLLEQIRNETDKYQKITIHEDTGITEMSASEFLFHILDRYQKLSQLFRKDSPDSCYLFEVKEDSSESFYTIGYFSSYSDCIGYHDKYLNEPSSYQAFSIRKIYLSLPAGDNVSAEKSIRASGLCQES